MLQAEQMQNRGVQVGGRGAINHGTIAEIVGRSIGLTAANAAAGQPDAETVGMMISSLLTLLYLCNLWMVSAF